MKLLGQEKIVRFNPVVLYPEARFPGMKPFLPWSLHDQLWDADAQVLQPRLMMMADFIELGARR